LGSAFVQITVTSDQNIEERLVFSGDLGRYDAPLHGDPATLPNCDAVVLESTYGDERHSDVPIEEQIRDPFERTFARGGTVLIPAFAVARAQLLLLLLRQLMESGRLRTVPIHVDSPMAMDVTSVYRRYLGSKGLDATHRDLFPRGVQYHRSVEDSKELSGLDGPRIIIAGSGMMTGGRVLHHLRRLLPDGKNLLVLAGYQAAGTRGRSLQDGARFIRMHGQDIPVRARFIQIEGLSAHADSADLVRWLQSAQVLPANAFLVHGEPPALAALSSRLSAMGIDVHVPKLNDRFESVQGKWRRL
jgi:metallo-beta-lactamase family protein